MKKKLSALFTMLILMCLLFSMPVYAEDDYTYIVGADSMGSAARISLNEEYAAALTGSEVLYFQFTTPSEKGFFDYYCKNINIATHSWSGDVQVQFELIDAVSEKMSLIRLGSGSEDTKNLPLNTSQTYYIKVYNKSPREENPSGNFKFKITYTQDKENDTKETASKIDLNEKVAGTLDGSTDIDYFKFHTNNEESFVLSAQNVNISTHSWAADSQFFVRVKSEIDEILAELRLTQGSEKSTKVNLQANTDYYIEVGNPQAGQGQYTFSLTEDSKKVKSILLKSETAAVARGSKYSLLKSIEPATAANKKLNWTSENTAIASVNANGQVTAKAVGSTVIKAVTTDGTNIEASCRIIVKPAKTQISKCKKVKDRNVVVTVKQQNNVSGIEYQLSRTKNFKKESTYRTGGSTTSAETDTLKANKTYYFRVRMYYDYGGRRYYGAWSQIKAVKTGKKSIDSGYFLWKDV